MLRMFLPRLLVDSVYEIDLDELASAGIRGIIADLDNTLIGAREPDATPKLKQWLETVRGKGFRVVVVSNNTRARVTRVAEPIDVAFIPSARKPLRGAFRKALDIMQLKPEQTAVVGDQLLTDVLGANRMGMHPILVAPVAPQDESPFTRFNRIIERRIFKSLRKRGLLEWND